MHNQQQTIRENITSQIISALEAENIPIWRQPWVGNGLPVNVVSNRRYSGINILLLQLHMLRHHLGSKVTVHGIRGVFAQWRQRRSHHMVVFSIERNKRQATPA